MKSKYCLWIASRSLCFEEIALALQAAFKELGYDVPITRNPNYEAEINIVLGPNILPRRTEQLPENMILFNMEQLDDDNPWFMPANGYMPFLKKYSVWDYSPQNIHNLKQRGISAIYCGIGYMPELTRIPSAPVMDIDVLFIGTIEERRQKIIDELQKSGVNIVVVTDKFGEERDALIARSKIILNIHQHSAKVLEIARISYLLANGNFVISEEGTDTALEYPYRDGIVFCPYELLTQTCLEYLQKPSERTEIAERGFVAFNQQSQVALLKAALEGPQSVKTENTSTKPQQPRIFVQIASYRDPECQHTVKDLFAKATHPERIFVGICWQYIDGEDDDCFILPYAYPAQVKEKHYAAEQSKGSGWARAEAMKLWQGEEYVLQVDAHMRFEQDWDEALLNTLARCPAEKAALSGMLISYDPPNRLDPRHSKELARVSLDKLPDSKDPAILPMRAIFSPKQGDVRSSIYPTPMQVGNFFFAPAAAFQEVPVDPYIYFRGEEIVQSARLWTHGWDIFQPDSNILYHYWMQTDNGKTYGYRGRKSDLVEKTRKRIRHLLGIELSEDAEALTELDAYGHGTERSLDSFWQFLGVDYEKNFMSEYTKSGYWHLLKEGQTGKMVSVPNEPRIFVQIASYRDPDCQWTVRDLFEKARRPDRISVGICWQYIKEEDQHCFEIETRPEQVRIIHVDARESKGACWARHKVQTLWQGEEYTLQIDAHMRFEHGWDVTMLEMIQKCGSPKSVITSYPPAYTPPDKLHKGWVMGIVAKEFMKEGIFTMKGFPISEKKLPEKPVLGAFIGACFLFGPSSIIRDIPYDPHLYFFGEEISLSVRFWTHGYDIYYPNKAVAYHDWHRTGRKDTHFSDHKNWGKLNSLSFQRVLYMLAQQPPEDRATLAEIEKYGLGNVRSLQEYQQFSGVDFKRREIEESAFKCIFPASRGETAQKNGADKLVNAGQPNISSTNTFSVNAKHPSENPAQFFIKTGHNNGPVKTYDSPQAVVYDNFLPEDMFDKLHDFLVKTDYHHINTTGKITRVWTLDNGFPLRSMFNGYFYASNAKNPKPEWVYPTSKPLDMFIERINKIQPEVEHITGKPVKDWDHFSVTSWLYPPNTGLSLHNDGSGVYTGAYTFFMNHEWRPHWGGILLMLPGETTERIDSRRSEEDGMSFFRKKWLHESGYNDIAMDVGYAQAIFPKRNRIVFIANDAYHMVTKVHPSAGDNVRMSLAGFFNRNTQGK